MKSLRLLFTILFIGLIITGCRQVAKPEAEAPVVSTPDVQRPLYVNSIAIGDDGTVYNLARITDNGKTRTDLISFPGPIKFVDPNESDIFN